MVVIVTVVTVVVRVTSFNKNNQLHTSTSVCFVQGSFLRFRDVYVMVQFIFLYTWAFGKFEAFFYRNRKKSMFS